MPQPALLSAPPSVSFFFPPQNTKPQSLSFLPSQPSRFFARRRACRLLSLRVRASVAIEKETPENDRPDTFLREAHERQESEIRPPQQKITDRTELHDYRLRKQKEFEDLIRRVRWNTSVWVKYAQWEESQKDYARTRSIWERALEVDYGNHTLWLKYGMKNKFANHARNVWDCAVQLLPHVDPLSSLLLPLSPSSSLPHVDPHVRLNIGSDAMPSSSLLLL